MLFILGGFFFSLGKKKKFLLAIFLFRFGFMAKFVGGFRGRSFLLRVGPNKPFCFFFFFFEISCSRGGEIFWVYFPQDYFSLGGKKFVFFFFFQEKSGLFFLGLSFKGRILRRGASVGGAGGFFVFKKGPLKMGGAIIPANFFLCYFEGYF